MLGEDFVGALVNGDSGLCVFEYAPSWINRGFSISPVHLPLTDQRFEFPGLSNETYKGLPGAFADTLPDDFGNAVINAWLAGKGRDAESFTTLERLLYTGQRGMGALEYLPALELTPSASSAIAIDSLVAMAQEVLDQRQGLGGTLKRKGEQSLTQIFQVGTSAGGARPKAVVGVNADRSEIRNGQLDLPEGFEHYLLKFDGTVEAGSENETFGDPKGYGRMEYAYFLMAKDAGLDISDCELLEESEGDRAHFMTKRFDRVGNQKVHYQSLCAMDHADYKRPGEYSYEQLLSLMRKLKFPREDALELFRRMVFNVVARNHDDHTKNFGFVFNHSDGWRLAPAFDVAYSYKPDSPWVNSHQLSINGKRDHFERADLLAVASSNMQSDARNIIDRVIEVVSDWRNYAKKAAVFPKLSQRIEENLRLSI
jgi:serine/threonine-protein kinase HipA